MRRGRKRRRSASKTPAAALAKGPFDLGAVPAAGARRSQGPSRRGAGRLGRALTAAGQKVPPPAPDQRPSPKALQRWENEGGRAAPPATKTSAKKAKPKSAKSGGRSATPRPAKGAKEPPCTFK